MTGTATSQGTKKPAVPISVIVGRIRVLVDYSLIQLRNFILFSAGPTNSSKNHFSIEESNVSSNMAESTECIGRIGERVSY